MGNAALAACLAGVAFDSHADEGSAGTVQKVSPVNVRLLGALRHVAADASLSVEVHSGDTVQDLLLRLSSYYPDLGKRILGSDGRIQGGINLLINGRDIRHLDGLDTPILEGDRVALFPAAGGG